MHQTLTFKITGMHCASCAMNIDDELEDTTKIISVSTNYAKAQTVVEFDSAVISEKEIIGIINKVGYTAERIS